jgi:hypothetical protein
MRKAERTKRIDAQSEALIRTIAGASRKLDEDLNLSSLQAIDRLQKLDEKFRPLWWKHPFLVLEDGYAIPAHMPVPTMLAQIETHGQPVGIVGVATLSTKKWTVLKQMFREDEKSRNTVESSATLAVSLFEDSLRSPYSGKVYTDGKSVKILYLWNHGTPEAGWHEAGRFDLFPNEDGTFELKIEKASSKWVAVMDKAREIFEPKMREIAEVLSSTKSKD